MKIQTNLDAVKSMAMAFLYMPIQETDFSPIVIMHPIFETGNFPVKVGDDWKMMNLMIPDELNLVRTQYEENIKQQKDLFGVYLLIRNSYRLTFLKHIRQYLSKEDKDKLLANAWVNSENPNQDSNVSLRTAASWFRQANKKYLMDIDEYAYYMKLPQILTIYRGVSVGRNPMGLSWTWSLDTAKWFAHRFDTQDKHGYVQMATIDKSEILAYFNGRDEDELVVDTLKIKERIRNVHE